LINYFYRLVIHGYALSLAQTYTTIFADGETVVIIGKKNLMAQ